ncbi:hypothetical protein R3P38DRAFT_2781458 [Favolaschia claudopus]|uniref:Uncharacterized protein n=1 Tax=Favolaschia claudopus TaxID=2862362 RepID=A0AAW0B5U4_9AGAR
MPAVGRSGPPKTRVSQLSPLATHWSTVSRVVAGYRHEYQQGEYAHKRWNHCIHGNFCSTAGCETVWRSLLLSSTLNVSTLMVGSHGCASPAETHGYCQVMVLLMSESHIRAVESEGAKQGPRYMPHRQRISRIGSPLVTPGTGLLQFSLADSILKVIRAVARHGRIGGLARLIVNNFEWSLAMNRVEASMGVAYGRAGLESVVQLLK